MKGQKLKGVELCGRYGPLNRLLLAALLCAFKLNAGSATLPLTPQKPDQSDRRPPCYHKDLDDWAFLEGDWTVRIKARLAAGGPWEETEASAQIKRELSGCLLAERFTGTRRGQPLHAHSLFAWNDNSKKLQQVFSDSGHGPLIFYEGVKVGQEILLDVDWNRPDGPSVRLRRAYFNLKPDSFTVESRRSPDGGKSWDTTGRMDYRRKSSNKTEAPGHWRWDGKRWSSVQVAGKRAARAGHK
ncbi:MAG: DUF1579 family protein [Blastocatellales bacterium]